MKKFLRTTLISIVVFMIVYFGAALVMIYLPEPDFATGPFPVEKNSSGDFTTLEFTMRDGETLFARQIPGESDLTILFLHGVNADGAVLTLSAQKINQASGAEVIVLDLRGHGQSGGAAGDVDYIGQYEDDVADVITSLRRMSPNNRIILAGHSMGGGIALQFAQLTDAPEVDGYLLFAPHLGNNSPTMPQLDPEAAEFAAVYSQLHVPRLIGLGMLNGMGIKTFNGLDTLFFNLTDEVTHIYSYRAMLNTSPVDYVAAITAVKKPTLVIVGRNDEAFVAEAFPKAFADTRDGEIYILDGETHGSIVESDPAMTLINQWILDKFN